MLMQEFFYFSVAFFPKLLYNIFRSFIRMWLSLVEHVLWELEHQNGSIAPNVAYFPLTSLLSPITSVESWAKLWYNFLDHIFDHNELFLLT